MLANAGHRGPENLEFHCASSACAVLNKARCANIRAHELRPARAGLLGPEDLALAREAAWILTRWWLDTTTAGADSWRCEANRVEVRRFGLTGANLLRDIAHEDGEALALEAAWIRVESCSAGADSWRCEAYRASQQGRGRR